MTCIVGLVHNGTVYLGGDSAGSCGDQLFHRANPKVFLLGDYVIGYCGSFRLGQILQYSFKPPVPSVKEDLDRFMATRFVASVKECLKKGGFPMEEGDSSFLVGYKGRLYQIFSDFHVGRADDPYDACGSGERIAMGSLYSTAHLPPNERLEVALKAAERYCATVRGPFRYVQTPKSSESAGKKSSSRKRR